MTPINPGNSLVEITTDRIRTAIIEGEFSLGEKLSEHRLAQMLNVSRSPVHEALAMLQLEGLVDVISKVGTFVFSPNLKKAHDLCDHRSILELACLKLAIERNQDELVGALSTQLSAMRHAISVGDQIGYTAGDMAFHNAVISCSGNHSIARAYPRILSPLMAIRTHVFAVINTGPEESMSEHAEFVSLCEKGDIQAAQSVLHHHVFNLLRVYKSSLSEEAQPHQELKEA